jgi:hypothetical protein
MSVPVLHALPVLTVSLSPTDLALLVLVSLIGGIGITTIGPGGVLVTIALYAFTDFSPAAVAGTAIVTHVGTGLVGSLAFARSGQLREPATQRLATVLCVAALIGTPAGVWINGQVSHALFGVLLALFVMLTGALVIARDMHNRRRADRPARLPGTMPQAALGGGVAVASGLFGVGGPMLSVPLMVIGGFPLLTALAAAQAQSIVVAGVGMAVYLAQGAVSWPLVLLTGVPEMIGVWFGWKIAHSVPARPLTYLLATVLLALGPVLFLRA